MERLMFRGCTSQYSNCSTNFYIKCVVQRLSWTGTNWQAFVMNGYKLACVMSCVLENSRQIRKHVGQGNDSFKHRSVLTDDRKYLKAVFTVVHCLGLVSRDIVPLTGTHRNTWPWLAEIIGPLYCSLTSCYSTCTNGQCEDILSCEYHYLAV